MTGEPCAVCRAPAKMAVLCAVAASAACASPEAGRTRGGGPGADIGNWSTEVEIHAGAKMYYRTPCVTQPVQCDGPAAVFGRTSNQD